MKKAANAGHVKAMLALGDIYNKSETETAGDKANAWYQKASDKGSIEAKRKLAQNIGMGRGKGEADYVRADALMAQAAAAGDGMAQLIYGRNLAGQGRYADAETWLLKAQAQGVKGANAALGALYYANDSTLKDMDKAFKWYTLAAADGDTQSQLNLSFMYFAGRGTTKDAAEAWKWLLLADNTQLNVRRAVGFLEENSKPEDRAEGEKRAEAWRQAHPDIHKR